MFLVSTTPSPNFLNYDRLLRQVMISDEIDRLARQEAIARFSNRQVYRGPVNDEILALHTRQFETVAAKAARPN